MSLAEVLNHTTTTQVRTDTEKDLTVALSKNGFAILRERIAERHATAEHVMWAAKEAMNRAEASMSDVEPVFALIEAIGSMRGVAADFGLTPKDVEDEMREILETAARPLDADSCANRLIRTLEDRETPEQKEARLDHDAASLYGESVV